MNSNANPASGVTVHAFLRPGMPQWAGSKLITQIADLYEFGVLGPGSVVWANLDIPDCMWVLGETSMFLTVTDVPTAGWVRLTRTSSAWGSTWRSALKNPSHKFDARDMPLTVQPHDTVAVALRNTDPRPMRAQFGTSTHAMTGYRADHGQMRVYDFKVGRGSRRDQGIVPDEFDRNHAGVRGLELMMCTTGPAMLPTLRREMDAFTTVLSEGVFSDIRGAQNNVHGATQEIIEPLVAAVSNVSGIGPLLNQVRAEKEEEDNAEMESMGLTDDGDGDGPAAA